MNSTSPRRIPLRVIAMGVCLGMILITGCAGKLGRGEKRSAESEIKLVIPDFPSAREQFEFAQVFQGSQVVSTDPGRRKMQMDKISQCYERVRSNFPGDAYYASRSSLEISTCAAMAGDVPRAIALFQETMARYPADDYVQARSLFSLGRLYDSQGRFDLGKSQYKLIMDKYSASQNGEVLQFVKKATAQYMQPREMRKQSNNRR